MTFDPDHGRTERATPPNPGSGGDGREIALPEALVRGSLDAIIVTDEDFNVRVWNPAAETIYGIPADDAWGRRVRAIVDTLDARGNPLDLVAAATELRTSGSWRGRVVHRPKTGSKAGIDLVIDSLVTLLPGADGHPIGTFGINRDVTETARVEAEIAALGSLVVGTDRARTKTEVAAAALDILCRATGADAGLVTASEGAYEATASVGVSQPTIDVILSYGQLGGPLAKALEPVDAYLSADVATAPLREDVRAAVLADGIAHLIVVGLRLAGRLIGILALGWRTAAPREPLRATMHQAAALVASSLENARLLSAVEAGLAEERLLTRRMRGLVELTQLPETSSGEFDTTRLLTDLRRVLGGDAALYGRVDGDRLVVAGMDDPQHEAARPLLEQPIERIPILDQLRAGAGAVIVPVGEPQTTAAGSAAMVARGLRTIVAFAQHDGAALAGVVLVAFRRPIEEVEIDERTLETIGRVLEIALSNRRLREAVGESVRRYRDLFESSPEALLVETPDRRIVDANPAAIRLYGEGLVGRSVQDIVDGEPAPIDPVSDPDAVIRMERMGRRLDGSTFPLEVELRAFAFGGEPHVLAMVRDLTEERRLQGELVQAQKMEAIGMLVAGVAHELNNPLASIVAFSQLIRTEPTLPADLRTQADLLVQEANRTRVIVQNLLDFARQRPPERVHTDLRPLVDSVLGLQAYVLTRNRVTVDIDIADDLPRLLVDRAQLQQVLINLTFNSAQAIKAGGRPGTIRIEARRGAAVGGEPGARVRIAIADDGPGVAPDVVDRLFVPFVTTKPPGEGTGLGLSVSFGIVTGHGGTLRHEPTAGGGATFVIELPVEAAEPERAIDDPAAAPPRAPAQSAAATPGSAPVSDPVPASPSADPPATRPDGPPARILVLDDEASIREFLGRVLLRYGYEPVLTSTGATALEIIRDDPPAAILCDHRMAGMSGTEFHDAVSAVAPALSKRFAFMSGDVLNPELRDFALARGVLLLAKPFDLATVESVVGRLLADRGAAAPEPA